MCIETVFFISPEWIHWFIDCYMVILLHSSHIFILHVCESICVLIKSHSSSSFSSSFFRIRQSIFSTLLNCTNITQFFSKAKPNWRSLICCLLWYFACVFILSLNDQLHRQSFLFPFSLSLLFYCLNGLTIKFLLPKHARVNWELIESFECW